MRIILALMLAAGLAWGGDDDFTNKQSEATSPAKLKLDLTKEVVWVGGSYWVADFYAVDSDGKTVRIRDTDGKMRDKVTLTWTADGSRAGQEITRPIWSGSRLPWTPRLLRTPGSTRNSLPKRPGSGRASRRGGRGTRGVFAR